jgi:hypothetical protein
VTANTPQSRKQKGRLFQQQIVKAILDFFPELTENDVKSTSMGKSGSDLELSEKALRMLNIEPECKFQEKLNVHNAMKQVIDRLNKKKPKQFKNVDTMVKTILKIPVLFFKKSYSEPYVCIRLDDFLSLLRSNYEQTKDFIR